MIIESLMKVQSGGHLTEGETTCVFGEIMRGEVAGEAVLAALLTSMQMNGPTAAEVVGATRAMRNACVHVNVPKDAVDIVGTGGDGFGTFNVSTTAAIIAAGAGVTIAKHGNRASTSKSGSADCLAALGYDLEKPIGEIERSVRENGIGFLFANKCHPAMRHAAPVRRALPFRTIFNLVGPLSNPAGVRRYALGAYSPKAMELYVDALRSLGAERALVFCGPDGLDELGISGASRVAERSGNGIVRNYEIEPERIFGKVRPVSSIAGGDPEANAQITLEVLAGRERGAYRDAASLNAAAAILAGGKAGTIEEGLALAYESIDSGRALSKLRSMVGRLPDDGRQPVG